MFRRFLDIITVIVAVIILFIWIIELRPVYRTTASILGDSDNYTYTDVK